MSQGDTAAPSQDLTKLPSNLPVPEDDGAAAHLVGRRIPAVRLPSTDGNEVTLDAAAGTMVLYLFPMIGRPDLPLPRGWDQKPGARGCTVQSLRYSEGLIDLANLGIETFGISSQDPVEQREAVARLGLRQILLSDCAGELREALRLPTFEIAGRIFLKRLTMMVVDGEIRRVWYPVFPPGQDVSAVKQWAAR